MGHTLVVREESYAAGSDGDPYYPVPNQRNRDLYEKYQMLAEKLEQTGRIQFVGRLANYKYFNMDQRHPMTEERKSCQNHIFVRGGRIDDEPVLWKGEFGMELRVIVPWAHHISTHCGGVATRGAPGTKYLYYFSSKHEVDKTVKRKPYLLPAGNPFKSTNVHMKAIPTKRWSPPPYKDFFRRTEFEMLLQGKPLVVILNKYVMEWGEAPVNYFSIPTLMTTLDYLTPKYTVLYKRHTSKGLRDKAGRELDLAEKGIIRSEHPGVLLFEDFAEVLDNPTEDSNLLLHGFMAQSKRFLTVQGGTAVQGSYFGGTNVILIKKGQEIERINLTTEEKASPWHGPGGDYSYFHKFANTTVIQTETDAAFLREMKKSM